MESTCTRCHQPVPAQSCFCPTCGLPQLVYERGDEAVGLGQADRWSEAVLDANQVEWRQAMRSALMVGIPAGILSSVEMPVSIFCLFWMAAASAWAVTLYVRRQKPAWITVGAGARIGLVTGLLGSWAAFLASGASLFATRFLFGAGNVLDEPWQALVKQLDQQLRSANANNPQALDLGTHMIAWLTSPQGRAGCMLFGIILLTCGLLIFSAAGGAIGARLLARRAAATRD